MFFIVVTIRSLAWTLLSVATVLMHILALMKSYWLIGPQFEILETDEDVRITDSNTTAASDLGDISTGSLGIFVSCEEIYHPSSGTIDVICGPYIKRLLDLPSGFWVVMVIFYALGLAIFAVTAIGSVLSLCKRSLCRKSIFTLSAFVQAVAGLFILLGLILYPFGWGNEVVQELCGQVTEPFIPRGCSVGWSFLLSIGALVLTFACSILGVQAEIATASDRVEAKVMQDKCFVCVP